MDAGSAMPTTGTGPPLAPPKFSAVGQPYWLDVTADDA